MALGITPDRLKPCSNEIMDYPRKNVSKKHTLYAPGVASQVDKHSSLLFAMQSAFREKLAVRMKTEKLNRTKHKSESENTLMQVYERRQNLVNTYSKNKTRSEPKNVSNGSSIRTRRLPPLSLRCNSDSTTYGRSGGSSVNKRLHSDVSEDMALPSSLTIIDQPTNKNKSFAALSSNLSHEKGAAEKLKFNRQEKHIEEDDLPPPNMAQLRMLSNKKKQLLKMKRYSLSDQNSDISLARNGVHQQSTLTDFQKWQLNQDKERQDRIVKHRKKTKGNDDVFVDINTTSNNSTPAPQHHTLLKQVNSKSSKSTNETNIHTSVPKHALSPAHGNFYDEHIENEAVTFFNETYSKQSGLSEQLHIYQNNHRIQAVLSDQSAPAMAGLQRPVLVRRDGRSAASSRTSTRNAFHSHSKVGNLPADNQRQNLGFKRKLSDQNIPSSTFSEETPLNQYNSQVIPEQGDVILVPCNTCGRKFNTERLERHRAVCVKTTSKKRKVFNMTQARRKGTDLETFAIVKGVSHNSRVAFPRKSNWRNQHEDFIKTIKQAKMMSLYVAGGGNLADLPPPEPSLNPDYVTCQYCERRFAPKVAERHIPRCKDIKSRPPPPKSKVPKAKQ